SLSLPSGRPGSIVTLDPARRDRRSIVDCFASGVFLATCLLDLLPDYLAGINDALKKLNVTLQFPLQEFILAMGFFLVLVLEQIVLSYKDQCVSSEEARSLLGSSPDGHLQQHHDARHASWRPDVPHVHVDLNAHSAVRSVALVLSLSLHSVFEGLAVGLQQDSGKVLEICLALLLHKCLIAFSLTLKLGQSRLRVRAVLAGVLLFSLMSPVGIGLGMALTQNGDTVHQLAWCVLDGLATGTFVYVAFLEILPHELSSAEPRIPKVIVLLCGFSVIAGVLFIKI
ncbi:hypothetical protein FKM82_016351, partial [Ascaphus truei]